MRYMSASAIAHKSLQDKTRQSLLVSYTPLGPKNNETRKLPLARHDAAFNAASAGQSHRSYAIDALPQRCARSRSSQHLKKHLDKHLKKR